MDWEKIFADDVTNQGLIYKNIQTAYTDKYIKKKKPLQSQMGRRPQ